jgi:hypothetical protein
MAMKGGPPTAQTPRIGGYFIPPLLRKRKGNKRKAGPRATGIDGVGLR